MLLPMLLQRLVSNELEQIVIVHSLLPAVKPKSVISPLLLGTALSFLSH